MLKLKVVAGVLSALVWCGASLAEPLYDAAKSAERVKAHMGFLASDLLEGRDTGARGHEIAAAYVATQLAQLGVKPGGENGGYYQSIALLSFRAADEGRLTVRAKGAAPAQLVFGDDYLPRPYPTAQELRLSAPVVFAGFGIVDKKAKRDDYRGLDAKGKIVAVLAGAPAGFQTEERAYHASIRTKFSVAAAHGAVGVLLIQTPAEESRRPFARLLSHRGVWDMTWRQPDGEYYLPGREAAPLGYISLAGAAKLFAGSPVPLDQVYRDAEAGKTKSFRLPVSLDAELNVETKPLTSVNVVGVVEGVDPVLKNEVIVISAHLDHFGVKEGGQGDVIFNGAMDNASGVATALEVARGFAEGQPPRRTVAFVFVTAEEKGHAGSQAFASYPTVPGRLAAVINLDMPMLTYDFIDVVAFGNERTNLGPVVRRAADRMGVSLSPDPLPQESLYTRSDHFSFVMQGVPAVYLITGFGGDGARAFGAFAAHNYHQPSDDLSQPIDYRVGAKFARLNYEIARDIANDDTRPAWLPGDFFGDLFAKPQQTVKKSPRR